MSNSYLITKAFKCTLVNMPLSLEITFSLLYEQKKDKKQSNFKG